jgi:hypothetical protein
MRNMRTRRSGFCIRIDSKEEEMFRVLSLRVLEYWLYPSAVAHNAGDAKISK